MNAARALVLALIAVSVPMVSQAQSYPSKPVRVIVTYAGIGEALIRAVGQKMAENMGVPVIVEGQAGAGGAIGAETVMRAAPDGYTVLATTAGTHVYRQLLVKNMSYDPIRDFTPLTMAFEAISVVAVHPSVPVNSIGEFLDYVRRNPGKLSYGTSGIGTQHHMASEILARATGIDMVHVPYKNGALSFQDAISGQIPVLFGVLAQIQPSAKAGKLRMLAITNDRRFSSAGDILPLRETVPAYSSPPFWTSYFGPANMQQPVVRRLQSEIVKALNVPEIHSKLTDAGFVVIGSSPEELAAAQKADIEQAGKIVKAVGIQPE